MIRQDYIDRAMSYGQYRSLLEQLMARGRTTGDNQSASYVHYGKLNLQRMHRLDKTAALTEELGALLKTIDTPYTWLVLSEGWCGDAAQSLPVFALIEKTCPSITLKVLLRDENLDIMGQHLTNSSASIPKLMCIETSTLKELFNWGPRPAEVQALAMELKKNGIPSEDKALLIQKWYNTDKTLSIQREIIALIREFLIKPKK